jgi:tetratricopeptide (TPR) repeat protein
MKYLIGLFFWLNLLNLFAQDWRNEVDIARDFYQKFNFEKAYIHYQKALKNLPKSIDINAEIAQCAYKKNAFQKARNYYSKSINSTKKSSEKAALNYNKGNAFMEEKNFTAAINSYKNALKNNPKDEEARYNLSQALRKTKKEDPKKNQKQPPQNQKKPEQKKPENKQDKKKDKQSNNQKKNENSSNNTLSKNTLEKKLDKISKAEAATKRKKFGKGNETNSQKSSKNW